MTNTVERLRRRVDELGGLLPTESSLSGYLFWLSRPRFWVYLAGPVVVGAVYAVDSVAELFSPLSIALFIFFLVPANVFLYGVNDLFDSDIDAENPKKEDKELRYRGGRVVASVVLASGLLGLAFVPVLSVPALLALGGFYLLAIEYSAPPLRAKTVPLLDSLSNGLYVLPGVLAYAALAGEYPPLAAIVGGWLWAMGMHTFSAIPDIEPDRKAGIETTATLLGERRTYAYCGACWIAAAGAFWFVHPFFGALLLSYPLLVFGIVASEVAVERAYWWYPAINTLVGTAMSLGGFWVLVYG
ncbi:lycopene elongase [Halobacteriales archaeon QS_3_64_16]|nr:MAG: lycopene elongase [Halobacteriales archaeon QS_3_64_16]